MKTSTHLLIFLLTILLPAALAAKGPGSGNGGPGPGPGMGGGGGVGQRPADHPASSINPAAFGTLDKFLSLSDEELLELEATLRRIRQMTPEERAAYRQKIARYTTLPEEERQQIQAGWGQLDVSIRTAWKQLMLQKTDEERTAVRDALQSVPPEKRTQWRMDLLREAGLLDEDESTLNPATEK